ncbi:MAG: protein translocase subunit SecF [Ilumatobacter sp.]|uniref:protein translocase subunit SecF n=1 Tax=Ilumatobacter sp. TaxID=1967498 RepID=UPI003297B202
MSRADQIAPTALGRLYRGQTAIDFYGRRRIGMYVAIVTLLVTVGSLFGQGISLGLDFEGGQAWDVPAGADFGVEEAEQVLSDNGVDVGGARIQLRESDSRSVIAVQIQVVDEATAASISQGFADASSATVDELNFEFTSSSWGADITRSAVRALVIFLIIVAIFISIRFEWRMAVSAIVAMANDVLFAVGVYSLFQFEITPATVIAFLTILGYSLYDTIVVFDRVQENEGKYASVRMPYPDIVNISMNQVLMRSINTSFSSLLPVVSLLLVGSGFLGAVSLREFALALLVGMISGIYSSIFIAAPLLAKLRSTTGRTSRRDLLTGDDLRAAVIGAGVSGRLASESPDARVAGSRKNERAENASLADEDAGSVRTRSTTDAIHQPAERILSHPPRPRKKKKRS